MNRTRSASTLALLLVMAAVPAAAQAPHAPPLPAIDSMALRAHTYLLTHDLLEGRGTGRRGADLAALYLATEAERLGLRGAGAGGSYYQPVPLVEATIDSGRTRLALIRDAGREEFPYGPGFIPMEGLLRDLVPFSGELVFLGTAQAVLAAHDSLPPLAGRVAVLLGTFGAQVRAADTLRARGATGVIHLVSDSNAFQRYRQAFGTTRVLLDPAAGAASSYAADIPEVLASPALRRAIVAALPGGEQALAGGAALSGLRVEVSIGTTTRPLTSRNVAALLPGSDSALAGEVVAYTAHLDHLGISIPDATGDSIYNGFSDDASGCAMLLAIAKAMTEVLRPARSVLFLFLTGEEAGLLGSDYYAAHPLIPPSRMVADINLDAGQPPAPSTDWRLAGADSSTLGAVAIELARRSGWTAQAAPASPNTDYFPLLRIGVPAIFVIPGPGPLEGLTAEASDALRRRWNHYHQASDNWYPDFPFSGMARIAEYALRLGYAVAAGPRPVMTSPH